MQRTKSMESLTEPQRIPRHRKNRVSMQSLYDYMVNGYKLENDNQIYSIYMPFHPAEANPISRIKEFIALNGPELWKNIHNIPYVMNWVKINGRLIRHPVNGDTIFHANPQLLYHFKGGAEALQLKNYYGESINIKHNNPPLDY